MTINKNFKSRPERLKYSQCMDFSLFGLDLKLLFMVTGAYYESGLFNNRPLRKGAKRGLGVDKHSVNFEIDGEDFHF